MGVFVPSLLIESTDSMIIASKVNVGAWHNLDKYMAQLWVLQLIGWTLPDNILIREPS